MAHRWKCRCQYLCVAPLQNIFIASGKGKKRRKKREKKKKRIGCSTKINFNTNQADTFLYTDEKKTKKKKKENKLLLLEFKKRSTCSASIHSENNAIR